jgi:3-dehydroquinate synthase
MRCQDSYIDISSKLEMPTNEELKQYSSLVLIFDKNTHRDCYPLIKTYFQELEPIIHIVEDGESFKTLQTCDDIWRKLIDHNIGKDSLIVNIGGGVICDLGGFISSIYKRGVNYWHIPTTLLSQVDAAIGGKNGVDYLNYKNQLGVISFPSRILIYPEFLKTLDLEQVISGFAEVVKYSLIKDKELWPLISTINDINNVHWHEIILRCVKVKSDIVNLDPYEKNLRKILNFGHTIGHALETHFLSIGEPILHGEAIAAGMECELYLSHELLGFDIEHIKEIRSFLHLHFPIIKIKNENIFDLISHMKKDKKNRSNKINFTLLSRIGIAEIDHEVDKKIIEEALKLYIRMTDDRN